MRIHRLDLSYAAHTAEEIHAGDAEMGTPDAA